MTIGPIGIGGSITTTKSGSTQLRETFLVLWPKAAFSACVDLPIAFKSELSNTLCGSAANRSSHSPLQYKTVKGRDQKARQHIRIKARCDLATLLDPPAGYIETDVPSVPNRSVWVNSSE